MRGFLARADEKFVKPAKVYPIKYQPIQHYKFEGRPIVRQEARFDRDALPIVFRVTPETLLNLCIKRVDAMPLPVVHKWTNLEVCKWIRKYGYPHYMNTFRVNFITGQKLLMLDARSLCAMNIKNLDDIKHIAYGIRVLLFYEMTKYIRSISLPPEYYYELYNLFEAKSGRKYHDVRRSDLWRRMQLLRKNSTNYSHWELLERWLARAQKEPELIGGFRRHCLYKCKPKPSPVEDYFRRAKPCHCMPPCSCYWTTERHLKEPLVFSLLKPHRKPEPCYDKNICKDCSPPCTSKWPSHFYKFGLMLTCLKATKYGERDKPKRTRFLSCESFH